MRTSEISQSAPTKVQWPLEIDTDGGTLWGDTWYPAGVPVVRNEPTPLYAEDWVFRS